MQPLEGLSSVEEQLIRHAQQNKVPINGSIELLPLCNMNCDMCYVRLERKTMEQKGRMLSAKEWLSIAEQMQRSGVLLMLLTGGEPLIYPEFKEVYLGLRKLGMIITINTNGTLIDDEWAAFFKKYPPRRINITIYGADKEAYDRLCHYPEGYDKVIRGIKLLKAAGISVKAAQSITKANVCDQSRIFDLTKELDVPCSCDCYMVPSMREREQSYAMQTRLDPEVAARARLVSVKSQLTEDEFLDSAKQLIDEIDVANENTGQDQSPGHLTCLAGSCSFTVNWQGMMRPCVLSSEPSISIREQSFEEAWKELRTKVDAIETGAKCNACRLKTLCRTCAVAALAETGDYKGIPEYLCKNTKAYEKLLREAVN